MDLSNLNLKFESSMSDIESWCNNQYQDYFSEYFINVKNLYLRLKSESKPITDQELEQILTDLPLELFSVSEVLNNFKLKSELISLEVKKEKREVENRSEASTQTARRDEANFSVIEDEFLIKAYNLIIDRVEHEISFSRELIMSAKKIWAARRDAEVVALPSDKSIEDLPNYLATNSESYIK